MRQRAVVFTVVWFEAYGSSAWTHLENWSVLEVHGVNTLFMGSENFPAFLAMLWYSFMTIPNRTRHTRLAAKIRLGDVKPSPMQFGFDTQRFALEGHLSGHNFTFDETAIRWLTQEWHVLFFQDGQTYYTLWKCFDRQGDYVGKERFSDTMVYCHFSLSESCLWFMGTVNLLSDPHSTECGEFLD